MRLGRCGWSLSWLVSSANRSRRIAVPRAALQRVVDGMVDLLGAAGTRAAGAGCRSVHLAAGGVSARVALRAGLLVGLLALVVAVGAIDARAAGLEGSIPASAGTPSGTSGSGGPPPEAVEASRIREARRREWWDSRAAKDERQRRRRAFKGMGRDEARALAVQQHPSAFVPDVWAPLAGVKRRGKFLNSYSAPVTLPNGHNAVAVSLLPLRTKDARGRLRPVDLSLAAGSGGLRPKNPFVETVLPERSSGVVQVGDLGFELGGDEPVQLENDRAFYADAGGEDIDLIVMPTPSGVESLAQIRSVHASETLRMQFELPSGARLRDVPGATNAALEVVRDGEVIATVTRPSAVDAQQRPVPVEYRVDGDELVMTVEHRSGDFAMPIMVDPEIIYGWDRTPRNREDATGWGTWQSNPWSRWCSYFGDSYLGLGQYTYGRTESWYPCASTWYSPGEVFEFNYYAEFWRGSSAFVEGWWEAHNFDAGSGGNCHYSGIYSVGIGRWETFSPNECWTLWNSLRFHGAYGHPGNFAVFGTFIGASGGPNQNFTNQLKGAVVYVSDRDYPTVEQGSWRIPSGWTKDTSFHVRGRDSGIGVDWTEMRATTPNAGDHYDSKHHPCSADPANHCPPSRDFSYTTYWMPEGIRTIKARAGDTIRQGYLTTLGDLKLDRSGPVLGSPRGSLWDRRNQDSDHSQEGLDGASYSMSIDATDGSQTNDTTRRSGVKKIDVRIMREDGTIAINSPDPKPLTCWADSCAHTRDYTLNTDDLPDGDYTVEVLAADQVWNWSNVTRWPITVNRRDTCSPQLVTTPPSPGGGSGTASGAITEAPQPVAAPDVRRQPLFDRFFASQDSAGFAPSGDAKCHVAAAVSDTQLLVSSERNSTVEISDVRTLAPLRTLSGVEGARGVAAYRGEGFVADRANRIFVFDPATGGYKRRFDHPTTVLVGSASALRQIAVTGLDVAWGEIWATFQTAAGNGVTVMDASNGQPKAVFFELPRYNCSTNPLALRLSGTCGSTTGVAVACASQVVFSSGAIRVDPTQCAAQITPTASTGRGDWWDMATVPEIDGTVAGCRFLRRNPLLTAASLPDTITPLSANGWQQCNDSKHQDGTDAAWGMRWLLALSGDSRTVPSNRINEYALNGAAAGAAVFDGPKRTWAPKDAAVVNHRDIAYRNRELRVTWTGDLTKTNWQRGQRCTDYNVTDADIFVVGRRGERWLELARGFQRIHLEIGGTERAAATTPDGRLCVDLDAIPSGTHTARLVATADAGQGPKTATVSNTTLRIDHDNPTVTPSGEWWDLRDQYVNGQGTHPLTATAHDDHSGIQQVAVEEVGKAEIDSGGPPCTTTQCPPDHTEAFTIDARSLSEGKHTFREIVRDMVPNNEGATPSWEVFVDRTAPTLSGDSVEAVFDPETLETEVSWEGGTDPPLADGSRGSGVWSYRYRVRRGTTDWSSWQASPGAGFILESSFPEEAITVEFQAVDRVSNVGPTAAGTDVAGPTTATAGDGRPVLSDSQTEQPLLLKASGSGEILCSGDNPCGKYDSQRARAYANYWYSRRNRKFPSFGGDGGDCTKLHKPSPTRGRLPLHAG